MDLIQKAVGLINLAWKSHGRLNPTIKNTLPLVWLHPLGETATFGSIVNVDDNLRLSIEVNHCFSVVWAQSEGQLPALTLTLGSLDGKTKVEKKKVNVNYTTDLTEFFSLVAPPAKVFLSEEEASLDALDAFFKEAAEDAWDQAEPEDLECPSCSRLAKTLDRVVDCLEKILERLD